MYLTCRGTLSFDMVLIGEGGGGGGGLVWVLNQRVQAISDDF